MTAISAAPQGSTWKPPAAQKSPAGVEVTRSAITHRIVARRSVARGLGLESVADAADRLDVGRILGVGLDLLAQRIDAAVDAAVGHDDVVAPDRLQDLVTGEGASRAPGEEGEQLEFLGRERHLGAVLQQAPRGQAEHEGAELP